MPGASDEVPPDSHAVRDGIDAMSCFADAVSARQYAVSPSSDGVPACGDGMPGVSDEMPSDTDVVPDGTDAMSGAADAVSARRYAVSRRGDTVSGASDEVSEVPTDTAGVPADRGAGVPGY
jgi:hypothetical protein